MEPPDPAVAVTGYLRIRGEVHGDRLVRGAIEHHVGVDRADRHAVDEHVGNVVAGIRSEDEALIRRHQLAVDARRSARWSRRGPRWR